MLGPNKTKKKINWKNQIVYFSSFIATVDSEAICSNIVLCGLMAMSCKSFKCSAKSLRYRKLSSHLAHLYGLPPVCCRRCNCNLQLDANPMASQSGHLNGYSSVWPRSWSFNFSLKSYQVIFTAISLNFYILWNESFLARFAFVYCAGVMIAPMTLHRFFRWKRLLANFACMQNWRRTSGCMRTQMTFQRVPIVKGFVTLRTLKIPKWQKHNL